MLSFKKIRESEQERNLHSGHLDSGWLQSDLWPQGLQVKRSQRALIPQASGQ